MDKDNSVTLEFSEDVTFSSISLLSSSLKTKIRGPEINYPHSSKFSDSVNEIQPGKKFRQLQVIIYDIMSTIQGGGQEEVIVSFIDLTVIKDVADNELAESKAVASLNFYEYVPESKSSSSHFM